MNDQKIDLKEKQLSYNLYIKGYTVCYNEKRNGYVLPGGQLVTKEEALKRYGRMLGL